MVLSDSAQALLVDILLRLGGAILIVIVGRWLAGVSRRWVGKLLAKTTISDTIRELTLKITYFGTFGTAILMALSVLGIPTTTLIAAVGVIVVVLGIALQESISNFAATIIFMMFEPFAVGDTIETGGEFGTVQELQIFNTVLLTPDEKVVSLPNAKIQSDGVTNYSKRPSLRVDLEVGISYEDDLIRAKQVAQDIVAADPSVLADPPLEVVVVELDDSSVNLSLRPFVNGKDYWDTKWRLTEQIKLGFDKAGISIPYPQRDVHMVSKANEGEGNG